jgi:hypothetical protein
LDLGNLLIFGCDFPEIRKDRPAGRKRLIKLGYLRPEGGKGILGVEPVAGGARCSRGKIKAARDQVPG